MATRARSASARSDAAPSRRAAHGAADASAARSDAAAASSAAALRSLIRNGFVVLDEVHHAAGERTWGDGVLTAFHDADRPTASID